MNTILAAVDFSSISADVVAAAISLRRSVPGKLILLNIFQLPNPTVSYQLEGEEIERLLAEAEREAKEELVVLAQGDPEVVLKTVYSNDFPAAKICEQARETNANLIVVGAHSHGALHELFVGSTTEGLLRHAPCPVLVVPVTSAE